MGLGLFRGFRVEFVGNQQKCRLEHHVGAGSSWELTMFKL